MESDPFLESILAKTEPGNLGSMLTEETTPLL